MINLKLYKGFALRRNDNSREAHQLALYCTQKDINLLWVGLKDKCPKEFIPVGSVEWCEQLLGNTVTPNYYPDWLEKHLHRKVWKSEQRVQDKKVFIKPSDKYKRFNGFINFGLWERKEKPPYNYSEVVEFVNEWRYYVSNGVVLCNGWYQGDDEEKQAPDLNINIPKNFCGTLDFGLLSTGELALVEAHHPFACGWYGEFSDIKLYLQWLVDGWDYMNKIGEIKNEN